MMVGGVTLSEDLTDTEWLCELEEIGRDRGYFAPLGDDHSVVFVDGDPSVLFVSFETRGAIRSFNGNGLPLGFGLPETNGWSHLSLVSNGDTWFRSRHVWSYFDRLVDEGFFEEFDRVVFYGAGMCGYAAAAYSVAAPGATVILISPQATLDPGLTEWDDRFPHMRRTDFTRRYGYAPDMIEAAERAFVVYDPGEELDAMHATLFVRPNVDRIRYRRGGAGSIDADLRAMGVFHTVVEAAAEGTLTRMTFLRALRERRTHLPYLRALLSRVQAEGRPYLTVLLCRAVLKVHRTPRFRHFLEEAAHELQVQGRRVPGGDIIPSA
jgi:hypothetical protein